MGCKTTVFVKLRNSQEVYLCSAKQKEAWEGEGVTEQFCLSVNPEHALAPNHVEEEHFIWLNC
jgi:hypothetical protein